MEDTYNESDLKRRRIIEPITSERPDLDLPDELLLKIFSFCRTRDFNSISIVDKVDYELQIN
jgi:hypothetical protein